MRRLASVFVSKRDRTDASTTTSSSTASQSNLSLPFKKSLRRGSSVNVGRLNTTLPFNDSAPSTPGLSARSDPAQSSASSSGSASLSLQTPEPHEELSPGLTPTLTPKSKSWKTWLSRRSGTIKLHHPKSDAPSIPQWQSTPLHIDTDDESESDNESEESSASGLHLPANKPIPVSPTTSPPSFTQSKHNLVAFTQNRVRHQKQASPFVQFHDTPQYPRSCHPAHTIYRESLCSELHRKSLLRRLQDEDSSFTPMEEQSILPFGASLVPVSPLTAARPLSTDDDALPKSVISSFTSLGLQRWINRPCFEDRYIVTYLTDGELVNTRVSASDFAVAELEYSDALLAMVDETVPESPKHSSLVAAINTSNPLTSRVSAYTMSNKPSPLRNEHSSETLPTSKLEEEKTKEVPAVVEQTVTEPVKRGVRFADDDKEDMIPIGYVLRLKKQRAQKAKFIQEEKDRRAHEIEKARIESERKQREQERQQWERERKAWEAEKKAMEEERKQRLYAEEVAAARTRRETQRMGHVASGVVPSGSSTSAQEPERNNRDSKRYSRPVYDASSAPRRQASEPGVTPSPSNSSPGGSRPGSVMGQSSLRPTPQSNSRTPSMHSMSSSEDVRNKDAGSRRSSVASNASNRINHDRTSAFATWTGGNPTLMVPPVPSMPAAYSLEMPLLPPTAPFMLQQYPRSKSSRDRSNSGPSSPPSPSTSQRLGNSSSDRVDVRHSNSPHRSNQSSSSPHRSSSRRRDSGENQSRPARTSSHSSLPPSPIQDSNHSGRSSSSSGHFSQPHTPPRSQPNSVSRGRPPFPVSYSQPIVYSWNAFPPQYGVPAMVPVGMPTMSGMAISDPNATPHYARANAPSARRQSTIS